MRSDRERVVDILETIAKIDRYTVKGIVERIKNRSEPDSQTESLATA